MMTLRYRLFLKAVQEQNWNLYAHIASDVSKRKISRENKCASIIPPVNIKALPATAVRECPRAKSGKWRRKMDKETITTVVWVLILSLAMFCLGIGLGYHHWPHGGRNASNNLQE